MMMAALVAAYLGFVLISGIATALNAPDDRICGPIYVPLVVLTLAALSRR